MKIIFDIETLPTNDPEVIADLAETIKAPATYKKPESIAQWMEENKEAALQDLVAKTSFSGLHGSIACICYTIDDSEVFSVDSRASEKRMLEDFYSHIYDATSTVAHHGVVEGSCTFVGHNVVGFDLPFLKHRSLILGVKPPASFIKAFSARPWDSVVADTMLMWSSDPHKRGSMDRLCKAFGFPGKGDFDGSMVAATWPVDPEKVIEYCKDDVRRTAMLHDRLSFNF